MNRENTKLMAILLLCFALTLIALAQALKARGSLPSSSDEATVASDGFDLPLESEYPEVMAVRR